MVKLLHLCYFFWSWNRYAQMFCRFFEYTPVNCFNNFVQPTVNARCQGDMNPSSSVVAETVKLLANSSYGYYLMDCSRHSVRRYMDDEKTHAAINNKTFKRLGHINDQVYEVEMVDFEFEHEEPFLVGFFILQYSKLRMLELYYNFLTKL